MVQESSKSQIDSMMINQYWNFGEQEELKMHSIHPYPAKFPAFIAEKAFEYAEREGVKVSKVADIFCGCGTVALESGLHGKAFWGCDINPVATLIARTKSQEYNITSTQSFFDKIKDDYLKTDEVPEDYSNANERIKYWFTERSFNQLNKLKKSIENTVTKKNYIDAFLCLFSSVLKPSSKWLTKSIKPQVDPQKKEIDVFIAFELQFKRFMKAIEQLKTYNFNPKEIDIVDGNFLELTGIPSVDLIVSSPPYVTSYEYADLHQLSSLWLNYATDYRELRKGSIGSMYGSKDYDSDKQNLNSIGKSIVSQLKDAGNANSKIQAIAHYYCDMQEAVKKCYQILNKGGMVLFVVGDTEYKGVKILNSEHLIMCLEEDGFSDIKKASRKISNKILTPYRDDKGKFTSDSKKRKVYHEEFVISARKKRQDYE